MFNGIAALTGGHPGAAYELIIMLVGIVQITSWAQTAVTMV